MIVTVEYATLEEHSSLPYHEYHLTSPLLCVAIHTASGETEYYIEPALQSIISPVVNHHTLSSTYQIPGAHILESCNEIHEFFLC